jgi:hypothetical protein
MLEHIQVTCNEIKYRKVTAPSLDEIIGFFSIYQILAVALRPWAASNRNEYQKIFLGREAHPAHEVSNLTATCVPIV